jgi:hypothetical protein
MIGRFSCGLLMAVLGTGGVLAQDVPGIEICTVEKAMERRTSCLQSNVDFLQKSIARLALDHQQKLDSAKAQIEALKANLVALQRVVDDLKAMQAKTPDSAKTNDAAAKDAVSKGAAIKDTSKDATGKGGTAKESGK